MKIYIYGTGSGAEKFFSRLYFNQVEIMGFLDSDKAKEGSEFLGYKVFHPTSISNSVFDYIVIASQYIEIYCYLLSLGFDDSIIIPAYHMNNILVKNNLLNSMVNISNPKFILTKKMIYSKGNELEKYYLDYKDYARFKTLTLIANEIETNNILGAVAEVGVFRGDFAFMINICFKDRKFYLFDTFEGFAEHEQKHDLEKDYIENEFFEKYDFKRTNVDIVLGKMMYRENCIVKKGYFPQTAIDLDEQFAFVSIDVDLFLPTLNALEYFYPRLSQGGIIFLHDYNNDELFGVKEAVLEYERKHGRLQKVPISDRGGTLVITK